MSVEITYRKGQANTYDVLHGVTDISLEKHGLGITTVRDDVKRRHFYCYAALVKYDYIM